MWNDLKALAAQHNSETDRAEGKTDTKLSFCGASLMIFYCKHIKRVNYQFRYFLRNKSELFEKKTN